jgi:hypothetical protein
MQDKISSPLSVDEESLVHLSEFFVQALTPNSALRQAYAAAAQGKASLPDKVSSALVRARDHLALHSSSLHPIEITEDMHAPGGFVVKFQDDNAGCLGGAARLFGR